MGECRLGEHVVGDPVGQLRERVRGAWRDHEQVGVRQMRVEILAFGPSSERQERLFGDEPLCAGRDERNHLVARPHEQACELAGLVGGDAAGDAEQNPAHAANCARASRPSYLAAVYFLYS